MADPAVQSSAGAQTDGDHEHTQTNGEQHESPETTSKFHQALSTWKSLNLTSLVSQLDVAASELVSQQRDSLVQRKDLAQKTKDFRKLDDDAKLSEVKDLLKAYQGYIDVITTNSKTISAAFMQAYTPLSDAPDPVPLLEISLDGVVAVDVEVPSLKQENTALAKQLERLNAQIEDTERQLDAERQKRESANRDVSSRLKEVEDRWAAVMKEKEDNWAVRETSLEERNEHMDRLLNELKASYEVSQRLEKSDDSVSNPVNTASAAELEILSSELDRANGHVHDLEARNESLRVELAQLSSATSSRNTSVEDDPSFQRLRTENTSLLRRLDSSRYDREKEKSTVEGKLRVLERDLTALRTDKENLTSRLAKYADYHELKRELEMLREVEFASVTVDDDATGSDGSKESLEQLLLARNKKLTTDLTELRVSHNELQQRLEQLQHDLSGTNLDLEKTRNLNAQLENDLQQAQQEATNAFETVSVAGTYTTRQHNRSVYGSTRRGGGTSPTSSIIGGFDPSASTNGSNSPRVLESLRASEPYGGGSGILPMVTAQRDRFKKKIGEMETDLQKQYLTVSSLRTEIASLQKDNLNLYEKTRYVSTYSRQPGSTTLAYGGASSGVSVDGSGTYDRYRSAYEANISPFAAFRGRESARALKRMSLPERAVWQMMRFVLATRASRNLFALYCVALHLLVLTMLYYSGTMQVQSYVGAAGAGVKSAMNSGADAVAAAVPGDTWQEGSFEGS